MPIHSPGRALAIGLLTLVGDATAAQGQPTFKTASSSQRSALMRELERLSNGLLFVSELDAPLTVVTWPRPGTRPTPRRLAALVGEPHPELAEQVTVDAFFRAALRVEPAPTAEDVFAARRYAALVQFLKSRLTDLQVYRFGRTTIRSYVVGVAPNGDWLGLTTNQTET
jgi:hypothetical protein